MYTNLNRLSPFIIGFYTWIVTAFFGAVLLDTVYARLVPDASAALSEVSDLLLLIGFLIILAAVGAIGFSWKKSIARYFFIASLFIILLEFLGPVFFSQLISSTHGSGLMTTIRITFNGMASILALIGLLQLNRQT